MIDSAWPKICCQFVSNSQEGISHSVFLSLAVKEWKYRLEYYGCWVLLADYKTFNSHKLTELEMVSTWVTWPHLTCGTEDWQLKQDMRSGAGVLGEKGVKRQYDQVGIIWWASMDSTLMRRSALQEIKGEIGFKKKSIQSNFLWDVQWQHILKDVENYKNLPCFRVYTANTNHCDSLIIRVKSTFLLWEFLMHEL